MKICFIIHDMTSRGGTERAQATLANALSTRGESISVWSMYGVRKFPGYPLLGDVKVSYGKRAPLPFFLDYPWLACAFAVHIIRLRPQWIVCTGTNRLMVALLAALVPGIKLAVWEHFPVSTSVTRPRARLARRIASVMASLIVTLTESDKELYAALYAPSGTITRIPNIVLSPGPSGAVRRKEVLAMGRLSREKGFDLLLEAWFSVADRLPDWSLRIVGDGKMRDQLAGQARSLGIESRITFAHFSEDPFPLYSECGIFVLSSRFECLPFALIEAMTCGAPCISFNCPNGPGELISDGVNGLLAGAENVDALANAIVRLGQDPGLRKRLGDAARSVAKPFSEPRVAARWHEALYHPMPLDGNDAPAQSGQRLQPDVRTQVQPASVFPVHPVMAPQASSAPGPMPLLGNQRELSAQAGEKPAYRRRNEMKLSVLMSVYHKETAANLRQCLDSLAMQTRPADEIVIVADGPLGRPLEATLAEYKATLPVVLLRLPVNVGTGAALRPGLNICQGKYVAHTDSADICVPDRFEKQVDFLDCNREVDVVGGAIAEFDEDCSIQRAIRTLPAEGPALRRFAKFRSPMNNTTVMFRKASVVASGNYESCLGFEDYHLWARMLTLGYRLHNMDEVLVNVRCGNGMQSRRGGFTYLRREIEFQSFLRKMGLLSASESCLNILMRGPIRLAPDSVRALCYSLFLRSSPASMQRVQH